MRGTLATGHSLAIEVQNSGGGLVSPSGIVFVARGASQNFVFSADGCYEVYDVTVDDVSVGAPASYTFMNVQSDHLLYVLFAWHVPGMTLSVSPSIGVCSRPDTLVAHVTGATQGQVDFFDADMRLGSASVVNGAASFVAKPPLAAGVHPLLARFTLSGCPGSGTSAVTSFTVSDSTADSLSVLLSLSPNPASSQEGVRAGVTLSTHGMSLDWIDGVAHVFADSIEVGTITLFRGVTSGFLGSTFEPGTYVLTARVTAGCFPTTNSNPVTLLVYAFQYTTLTLTSDPDPAHPGQSVTVLAHVSPATAQGRVTFRDAGTNAVLATADLVGGVASWTHVAQYGTEPTVIAQYSGAHFFGSSDSQPFKARVVGGVATQKAYVYPPGRYTCAAEYLGDSLYDARREYADVSDIGQSANTVLLDSHNPSLLGEATNVTCVVGPPESPGSVTFAADGMPHLVVPVDFGVANFSTAALPLGDHPIVAQWSEEYGATSNVITHRVVDGLGVRLIVLAPNGGENLVVGQPVEIRWVPYQFIDYYPHYCSCVDVSLRRAPGAPWERLARMANTGSFIWTVTSPGTNTGAPRVYSALISVSAASGALPSGTSSAPFSIFDATTETEVARFDAEAEDAGVRVSWVIPAAAGGTTLELQRAPTRDGPWSRLDLAAHEQSGTFTVDDRDVVAGNTYWYRLIAAGSSTPAALTSVTAGLPRKFALDIAGANPTRGAVSVRYSVATPSRIRLTMLDLQGREVRVLADGSFAAGRYEATAGVRSGGAALAAGIYFVRLTSPGRRLVQRIAIVR